MILWWLPTAVACDAESPSDDGAGSLEQACDLGSERCPCVEGERCLSPLQCLSGLCVMPEEATSSPGQPNSETDAGPEGAGGEMMADGSGTGASSEGAGGGDGSAGSDPGGAASDPGNDSGSTPSDGPPGSDETGACTAGQTPDCAGVCGGGAALDCAGVCDGGAVVDCAGVCGGGAALDCAGVCNGGAVVDCAGVCDGSAAVDCAGVCNGGAAVDCAGLCNGGAVVDCAGVCNGAAVVDCAGVCGGLAVVDCAGACNGAAVVDCAGVCGGAAEEDCAGVCSGSAVLDCAGVCNGDAVVDCAGVCGGNAVDDCAGVCGGAAEEDCAGVCGGDAGEDCAGVCGGDAVEDCAGVCGGDAVEDPSGECLLSTPTLPPITGDCPEFVSSSISLGGNDGITIEVGPQAASGGSLIFYWHGTGSSAEEYLVMGDPVIDEVLAAGGIIVSPQGTVGGDACSGNSTFGVADFEWAYQLAACAVRDHNIDPRRIYTTGCSAGGLQAGCMLMRRSSYIAAVTTNSGGSTFPQSRDDTSHIPPVMTMHGAPGVDVVIIDFSVASTTLREAVVDAGGFAVNCNHGGGHCGATGALQLAAWRFMQAHPFGGGPPPWTDGLPEEMPDYCEITPTP